MQHLRKLSIPQNMTMVFYTADTVPKVFRGHPLIVHTTDNHRSHLLFPTPYLLRDLNNGHLNSVLKFCKMPSSLKNRAAALYFRGAWRNPFRLKVARFAIRRNKKSAQLGRNTSSNLVTFDVQLTNLPKGTTDLARVPVTPWTEKMKKQYLLTLRGGASSQWGLYHDFVAGGVIVRFSDDLYEYWNYDILSQNSSAVVNVDNVESLADAILNLRVQKRKHEMAHESRRCACTRLQPDAIRRYTQAFIVEYGKRFGGTLVRGSK